MNIMSRLFTCFKNVLGITNRKNDILYKAPQNLSDTSRIIVFFCGDMQDFRKNMAIYRHCSTFQEWSLEKTTLIMSNHFPDSHILVIRPSRQKLISNIVILNCFDNFVQGSELGTPIHSSNYSSLQHLKSLLQSLGRMMKNTKTDMNEREISVIGFSKGCIVLNQFLHEFHHYLTSTEENTEEKQFISRIRDMWWLDGGHPGQKDTWITNKVILDSFGKLGIDVHVHITPYQVRDAQRPWIRSEEETFSNILRHGGVNISHCLHFENEPRKLEYHFKLLGIFK